MSKLTDSQKIEIVDKYSNFNYDLKTLAKFYKVSSNNIRQILLRRKVTLNSKLRTKYTIDTKYFEKIDTEDKAYFLGLMYADGYNFNKGFSINLQEVDKEILEQFKKYLNYSGELTKLINKSNGKIYPNLAINRRKMAEDLTKLGCIKAKSKVLTFPTEEQVPPFLIRHFIRGYFDGDGSLSKSKTGSWACAISSTLMFNESLNEIISSQLNIKCGIYKDNGCHDLYRRLCFSTKDKIFKFLNWIYRDTIIYLNRKYQKYLEFSKEVAAHSVITPTPEEVVTL